MAWTEETRKELEDILPRIKSDCDHIRYSCEDIGCWNGPLARGLAAALEEIKRLKARAERAERNARCYANELPPDPDLDGPIPVEETRLYKAEAELERCRQALAEAGIMLNYSPPEIDEAKRLIRVALAGEKREEKSDG